MTLDAKRRAAKEALRSTILLNVLEQASGKVDECAHTRDQAHIGWIVDVDAGNIEWLAAIKLPAKGDCKWPVA